MREVSIAALFGTSFVAVLTACGGHEVDFARSLAVPAPVDLILRNGKIVTVDRDFSIKEAVAVRGGRSSPSAPTAICAR